MTLIGLEQSCLNDGKWQLAQLLTMLPEPPWSRIGRRNAPDLIHQFSKLADPSWIAATMAYIKDISALAEFQKKTPKGDGKGGGKAQKGQTEE